MIFVKINDVAFFFSTLCAETLFPLYFEPMPNLSKTLEGLLTPLVIFVNTILFTEYYCHIP